MLRQQGALEVVAGPGPRGLRRMLVFLAAAVLRLARTQAARVLQRLLLAAAVRCSQWLLLQGCRGRCSAIRA
jgi:hypothetical protein